MKLAIYDFDGTYMNSEILRTVYDFWKTKKLNMKMHRWIFFKIVITNLLYKLHLFGWDKPKFRMNAMAMTSDLFNSISENALDIFLEEVYLFLQDKINQDIKEQLKKDKENGYYTVLLSGNFNCILKPFLKDGFDEVIGSIARVNGKMLKPKDIKIIINKVKAETIKSRFPNADFKSSIAYADSYYDLPILELVGNAVAYHPDEELQKIAKERDYRIWKNTEKR